MTPQAPSSDIHSLKQAGNEVSSGNPQGPAGPCGCGGSGGPQERQGPVCAGRRFRLKGL